MTLLNALISTIQANQFLAAGAGLYGAGMLTFFVVKVPVKIKTFVETYITTSVSFDNSDNGFAERTYDNFAAWLETNKLIKWSRNFQIDSNITTEQSRLTIGTGRHYFWYQHKLFWIDKSKMEKSQTARVLYQITLGYFGRNKRVLEEVTAKLVHIPSRDQIGVRSFDGYGWCLLKSVKLRSLDSVVVNRDTKQQILNILDDFAQPGKEEWYDARGLAYKKTILLEGPPGTGKTSLIKALAGYYKRNLCVVNIASMTDATLQEALHNLPDNSFLAIEDIDSSQAMRGETPSTATERLSVTGVLNTLDGLVGLNNVVVFMTTNHLDKLDPAVTRKGRVDAIYHLGSLESPEINDYAELMYGHRPNRDFKPALGCDIQAKYFEHQTDMHAFIESLST